MSDPRNILQDKFAEPHRFANFGNVLTQMDIQGFRCHRNTVIEIRCPITAFCGLNGTGKSTILQLSAAAYGNTITPNHYLRDFFIVSSLDPAPFREDARIIFRYWQNDRNTRQLTISRSKNSWSGYKRRPKRSVFFAGVGVFLPKIEKKDFSIYQAAILHVDATEIVSEQIRTTSGRILSRNYDQMKSCQVSCGHRKGKILSVDRIGSTYSEAHMGFGEGRASFLVSRLETLPDRSTILIEEPETSLHPNAQHEFGKFLVDVAIRKGHQILLTTHSEKVLEALPSISRVYLDSSESGIRLIEGLSAAQANSLMSCGYSKALCVLVEDECAKTILTEMVRKVDADLLRTLHVQVGGDSNVIARTVSSLKGTDIRIAAVRDGDQGESPKENIFKLPGKLPPEKEIFQTNGIKEYLLEYYGVNWEDFQASLTGIDHHEWIPRLSEHISVNSEALMVELARKYVETVDCVTLAKLLREAMLSK